MWHAFARQLSNPRGLAGRAVGMLMTIANRAPTRLAINALAIRPGDDVLDMGCGAGQATALMLPLARPGRVDGIDQSAVMVSQARRANRNALRRGWSRFQQADFAKLPFPDASFDRVLASNVMYFWQRTDLILREIKRILRPGGRMSIYLTSAETMRHWKFADAGTHRLFDVADVETALIEAGFAPDHFSVERVPMRGGVIGILAHVARDGAGAS